MLGLVLFCRTKSEDLSWRALLSGKWFYPEDKRTLVWRGLIKNDMNMVPHEFGPARFILQKHSETMRTVSVRIGGARVPGTLRGGQIQH